MKKSNAIRDCILGTVTIPSNIHEEIDTLGDAAHDRFMDSVYEKIENGNVTSPPEQLFFATWIYIDEHEKFYPYRLELFPQYKIGKYFADFKIDFFAMFMESPLFINEDLLKEINEDQPRMVIEIDGHKWHEKSMDQVEYDKKRERFFISQGYTVLRYAAREVLKNADNCVEEVRRHCNKIQIDYIRKWIGKFK